MSDASKKSGRLHWQSLSHIDDTPEVRAMMENEFAGYDPTAIASMPRRRFLKLMGASMALSGLTLSGCRRWPQERLAPYTAGVRDRTPGVPEHYATTCELGGIGIGLLATAYDGRPIKVEGNPSHPASATFEGKLGSADRYAQASVLELYDPDRSRFVIDRTGSSPRQATYDEFLAGFLEYLRTNCPNGEGFAVLSEASESPSVAAAKAALAGAMRSTRFFEYEPISFDNETEGVKNATGVAGRSVMVLGTARTIVSFDCDFLGTHPNRTRYANDFAKMRRNADAHDEMSRLYVADTTFSITGANADERLPIRPSKIEALIGALAATLGVSGAAAGGSLDANEQAWVQHAAADLRKGGGVVTVGFNCSPAAHAAAVAINGQIGSTGSTVRYVRTAERPSHIGSISALASELSTGNIRAILIIGGNPAFDAPVDLDFTAALAKAPMSAHLSFYLNETSSACKWHAPRAHYLEAWGDSRSWDGTVATAQPLIEPIFGGWSATQLLTALAGQDAADSERLVRSHVGGLAGGTATDDTWRGWIHDGVMANSAYPAIETGAAGAAGFPQFAAAASGQWEVRFLPHYGIYDGRFANNAWLLEMPDPMTKLTWDNAALISKKDADELGVINGSMLDLTIDGRKLSIPAYILPGQPSRVIALSLGHGRKFAGSVGGWEPENVATCGFNVYAARTARTFFGASDVQVAKGAGTYELVSTIDHFLIDEVGFRGREKRVGKKSESGLSVREATVGAYLSHHRDPHVFAAPDSHGATPKLQLFKAVTNYPQRDPGAPTLFNNPHAWGMSIDMTACIGCNACVVACQAENNVPVVGKENVKVNRDMHWLRIDRYFKGERDDPNPAVTFQPMMCVHCENAPCEQVCPVAATVHDTEGLNTMVYNRCIGTRYCSNNCPYKVRRFNYFDWHSVGPRSGRHKLPWLGMPDSQQNNSVDPLASMGFNPEVSVRMRGVMEKCTYCTQRIAAAKINARNLWKQGRRASDEVADGEIITACQQACPTEAIVFGNLNDKTSAVRALHANPRSYMVLEELNSRPRTRHLAKLRNPAVEPKPAAAGEAH